MQAATLSNGRTTPMHQEGPVAIITHAAHPDAVALLTHVCQVITLAGDHAQSRSLQNVDPSGVAALMVFMPDRVDGDTIRRYPELKVIAGAFKGADNICIDTCTASGVWLTVATDALTAPTAELALALLLASARRVREGDAIVRQEGRGGWRPGLHGFSIRDCTIGIVGAGAVGRELGRMLSALGASPVFHDPLAQQVYGVPYLPLATLMRRSRAVVLALPLTDETWHLVGEDQILLMPDDSVLVNVGRGSTVDEDAVAHALTAGHLSAYAADVFAMEDAKQCEQSKIAASLLNHPRCIFTPHIGSATASARREIEMQAAQSILQALQGERPKGAINLPVTQDKYSEGMYS